MTDDDELLAHYLERGGAAWNVSLEAAWLDYELRAWLAPRLEAHRGAAVCNVGIGVGLLDDWMGYLLGSSITSVDRDPDICRVFALRQRREGHPHPSHVICGDVLDGVLGEAQFDVVTLVGSTVAESGDRDRLHAAISRGLRGGVLLAAEVGQGPPPRDVTSRRGDLWIAARELR